MADLIWSPRALDNIAAAEAYFSRSSETRARDFVRGVFTAAEGLRDHPLLGAVVPEYELTGLRELQHQSYRILYRLRDTDIEIVLVMHGARQLPRKPPA